MKKSALIVLFFCFVFSSLWGQNSNTTLIGRWANGPCYAVTVVGNIAYVGNGGYLEVVDVSNPAAPVELGKVVNPSAVLGVAVSGSYAYVADGADGLRIIDVSDPANPVETGFYDTGGWAYGVAVSGSYAYVADWNDGLYIIQNDLLVGIQDNSAAIVKDFNLQQNYPNPFNPVTTIGFRIARRGWVELSITDALGREVKTLVNGRKLPGTYTVQWDGTNDAGQRGASGVYFYRLKSGNYVQTRKMLLLR